VSRGGAEKSQQQQQSEDQLDNPVVPIEEDDGVVKTHSDQPVPAEDANPDQPNNDIDAAKESIDVVITMTIFLIWGIYLFDNFVGVCTKNILLRLFHRRITNLQP